MPDPRAIRLAAAVTPADAEQRLAVFCPGPLLTVTIERFDDGDDSIHLHAGGQGVWVARMAKELGALPVVCAPLGGEAGAVVEDLLRGEGIALRRVDRAGASAAYVHDRRGGHRVQLAEQGASRLDRHEVDELVNVALSHGVECGTAVITGTADRRVLPSVTFEQLVADLRAMGVNTVADLSGPQLDAAVDGGIDTVKVSDVELSADGRVTGESTDDVIAAAERLRAAGAGTVVVSRQQRPVVAVGPAGIWEAEVVPLTVVDHRGAGDSMTAAIAVSIGRGAPIVEALRLGVAAGSLNVTRHGLATGPRDAIESLSRAVEVRRLG